MSDLNYRSVKGSPLTIQEMDENFQNLNQDKIEAGLDGKIALEVLPDVYIAGGTGSGTQGDPFFFGSGSGGGIGNPDALPGFNPDETQLLYQVDGEWQLGPIPTGNDQPLGTPDLVAGSPSVNAVPFSWAAVLDAAQYELRRGTTNNAATASVVYNGPSLSFVDDGLTNSTTYYWFLRAKAAGRVSSAFDSVSATTPATGNITPPAPTAMVVNDVSKTFTFTNAVGYATTVHEWRRKQGGVWGAWTTVAAKPVSVGNIYIPVGDLEVRVMAQPGVSAGPVLTNSTAFIIVPAAPTNFVVDDVNDTAGFTPSSGYLATDHEYQIGSSAWNPVVSNPVPTGNIPIGIGELKIRVKAATGRTFSAALTNPTAYTQFIAYEDLNTNWQVGDSIVVVTGNDITYNGNQRARNDKYLPANTNGRLKASVSVAGAIGFGANDGSLAGRNEMRFGAARESNNRVQFFSLGTNLFQSAVITGDAIVEFVVENGEWIGYVNGVEIGRMNALSGSHKPHSFGDAGATVNDVQHLSFIL